MATLKLKEVYDIREIDWFTGERIPYTPGEGATCHRCGKEHARVYVIEDLDTRKVYEVGSTCCKRIFDGWEPDTAILRTKLREERERARNKASQKLDVLALPIVEKVQALIVPEPVFIGKIPVQARFEVDEYGADGITVWCEHGLTDERRDCFRRSWTIRRIAEEATALFPDNSSKAYRVQERAQILMGVGF